MSKNEFFCQLSFAAPDFVAVVNIRNTGQHAGDKWSTLGHLRSNDRSHLGVNELLGT
jgi:hypothetical protein